MKLQLNPMPAIANFFLAFLSKYSIQQEEILGLDITPRSIRLIQLSKKGNEWIVEKLAQRHIEGLSDIKLDSKRIADEIQIALKAGKFSTLNAAISLPVSNSIIKVIPIPLMNDEEMQKSIETASLWENTTQLPDALENYSIFHQVIRKDPASNMMDVLFVASKLTDVNTLVDLVSKGGINPVVLDVRCFALRNAFQTVKKTANKKKPLAILEIGEYENYLLIIKEENPYVSDIFVSAKDKESIGKANISKENLSLIIDRYVMQIKQNLVSYANRYKIDKVDNLNIVSQSPNIDEIVSLLSAKLKDIKILVFNPFQEIKLPAQISNKLKTEDNLSSFTTSVGLGTRKLDIFGYYKKVTGVQNINLLPNRDIVKKNKRTKLVSGFLVFIAVVIILISTGYYGYKFYNSLNKNEKELTDYYTTKDLINNKQIEYFGLKNKIDKLNEQLGLSETATTNQLTAALVLKEISNIEELNIGITNIKFDGNNEYEIKGFALEGQLNSDDTRSNGSADQTVIEYISRLKSNSIFEKAILVKSSANQDFPDVKDFIINLIVKPELMNAKTLGDK